MESNLPKFPRGNGPGWGGAAKGAGRGTKQPFTAESPNPGGGKITQRGIERRELKIATAEELKAVLSNIALTSHHEANRINAASHLLDRIEGKPVQRTRLGGEEGQPLGFVLIGVPTAADAKEWQNQYTPLTEDK